jgi:hypothetical protein
MKKWKEVFIEALAWIIVLALFIFVFKILNK